MKLLYVGDTYAGDDGHVQALSRIPSLSGHAVSTSFVKRETAIEVSLLCQARGFDAVICSQPALMQATLRAMPGFIPPPGKKALTLDNYAGSMLALPHDIPLLMINPLERLNTVPYEKFILDRFISKLTKPAKWWQQTVFKWQQVHEHTADAVLAEMASADLMAIDIETPGSDDRHIKLVGYATYNYATRNSKCYVVHFTSEWAWRFVQKANKMPAAKIMQNGQYDSTYFVRWNCVPTNWLWDTLTLMHCWYSELPKVLDFIAAFSLRNMRFWKDDGKTGSLEDEMRYNALDCWATLNAMLSMVSEMPAYAMRNYLQEFPMNFPCLTCALEGMPVDEKRFDEVVLEKTAEAEKTLEKVRFWLSSPGFNPRSPKQMTALFKLLGCGSLPDTTKASQLKARAASPLNDLILSEVAEYKSAAKLISSYLDKEKIWNGRWYYSIDPAATDTGRTGSRGSAFWCGDSIQVIPRGDTIKSFFLADTGWLLAEADKAQAEPRCVGYLSGETALIDLVESEKNYHAWNAHKFFAVPYEAIYNQETGVKLDKEIYDLSKRVNNGANYNMGANVMLDTMGPKNVAKAKITLKRPFKERLRDVCAYLLERYAATYPRVKGLFYDTIVRDIEVSSKLVSPLGWTRYFFSKPSRRNKPALNAAVAHPPQNLSVSILNREWYAIWRETIHGSLRNRVRIKAQIHDSLLFQYRPDFDPRRVVEMMQTPVQVTGADGVTRTMLLPSELKSGADRWSLLK